MCKRDWAKNEQFSFSQSDFSENLEVPWITVLADCGRNLKFDTDVLKIIYEVFFTLYIYIFASYLTAVLFETNILHILNALLTQKISWISEKWKNCGMFNILEKEHNSYVWFLDSKIGFSNRLEFSNHEDRWLMVIAILSKEMICWIKVP